MRSKSQCSGVVSVVETFVNRTIRISVCMMSPITLEALSCRVTFRQHFDFSTRGVFELVKRRWELRTLVLVSEVIKNLLARHWKWLLKTNHTHWVLGSDSVMLLYSARLVGFAKLLPLPYTSLHVSKASAADDWWSAIAKHRSSTSATSRISAYGNTLLVYCKANRTILVTTVTNSLFISLLFGWASSKQLEAVHSMSFAENGQRQVACILLPVKDPVWYGMFDHMAI